MANESLLDGVEVEDTQEVETTEVDASNDVDSPRIVDEPERIEDAPEQPEKPEWLLDKYAVDGKSLEEAIAEQAKAYSEAQKRLGAFTGAPEEYELTLPEGVDGDVDTELPQYQQFVEFAKDKNISNESAQELFNIFVSYQNDIISQYTADYQEQREILGDEADKIIGSVAKWSSANLGEEDMKTLESMTYTADQVKLLNKMIGMTRNSKVPSSDDTAIPQGYSWFQFDQDVNSERFKKDKDFREEIRQKAEKLPKRD